MEKCENKKHSFHLCGTGSINVKGQIVIPKDTREKLGIHPGDNFTFLVKDNEAIIVIPNEGLDCLMSYIESEKNKQFISNI